MSMWLSLCKRGQSILIASLFLVGACTPSGLVRSATPAAIRGGAEGLADPQTQADLASAMSSPAMQDAIKGLTKSITLALLDSLDETTRDARLQQIITRFAHDVTPLINRATMPLVDGTTRTAIGAALDQASSDASIAETKKLVAAITDSALASLDARAAEDLREQLGPALASAIEKDISPAISRSMSAEKMGGVGREMGKQFVLGANDGLAEIDQSGRSLVERALTARPAFPWLLVLSIVFGLTTLLFAGYGYLEKRRARRMRTTLLALAAGLDGTDRAAWSDELVDVLSDSAHDERLVQRLATVLAKRNKPSRVSTQTLDGE